MHNARKRWERLRQRPPREVWRTERQRLADLLQ
jgi:hypothetical protein